MSTAVTISGSSAHASASATDRIPASKAGVKGYLTNSQIRDYILGLANTWTGQNIFAAGTVTTSKPLTSSQTWNNGATVFTSISSAITDTASDGNSKHIDCLVGVSSYFSVSGYGIVRAGAAFTDSSNAFGLGVRSSAAMQITSALALAWTSGSSYGDTQDLFITRGGAASLQLGAADADTNAAAVAQTIRSQGLVTGGSSDQAGKDWTFIASPGKGTGAGGSFIFKVAPAGSTGSTPNTPVAGLTIASTLLATLGGPLSRGNVVTKTGDFSLAATENWVICNKGSDTQVTLPAASAWPGREIYMKTIQAQTVTSVSSNVVPNTTASAGTAILPGTDGAWCIMVSDGTNWIRMASSTIA
jgi:hypothetical protein